MKENKDNKQKILEASANLEIAKMLNAIEEMYKKSINFNDTRRFDFNKLQQNLQQMIDFVKAFSQFQKSEQCMWKEAKMVTDIVSWIKSKAKYEEKILELEAKLERWRKAYNTVVNDNNKIKNQFINFVNKFIEWEYQLSNDDKERFSKWLENDTRPLSKLIDDSMESFYMKRKEECKIDNPF